MTSYMKKNRLDKNGTCNCCYKNKYKFKGQRSNALYCIDE